MKTTHLLATVAAALLLNASAASAQGMGNKSEGAGQAPAAQQKAPAEKQAPAMKQGAGDHKPNDQRAGKKPAETTGQASDKDKGGAMNKGADSKASDSKAGDSMKKGNEAQKAPDAKSGNQAQSPSATSPTQNKAQSQTGTNSNQSTSSSSTTTQQGTTGQGAAAGAANISTEQRTKITSVIKQQNVQRVDRASLKVDIRVGARIPTSVHFYPLPAQVVEIHPAWRGFLYVLVDNEILVINPRTHEIVAILEA